MGGQRSKKDSMAFLPDMSSTPLSPVEEGLRLSKEIMIFRKYGCRNWPDAPAEAVREYADFLQDRSRAGILSARRS